MTTPRTTAAAALLVAVGLVSACSSSGSAPDEGTTTEPVTPPPVVTDEPFVISPPIAVAPPVFASPPTVPQVSMQASLGGVLDLVDGCFVLRPGPAAVEPATGRGSLIVFPPGTALSPRSVNSVDVPGSGTFTVGDTLAAGGGSGDTTMPYDRADECPVAEFDGVVQLDTIEP